MEDKIKYITVLMPAYNCGKYIKSSIKSILSQTYKDFEFLIIDDGSTDDTEEIVTSFKDSRIIYKRKEHNGISATLNFGLSIAAGDWVARIDADDLNTPNRLEKQINFIEQNPEYNIVSSWSVYFNDAKKILFALKEPNEHKDIYRYLNLHNPLNQSAVFYKKDLILQHKYNVQYRSYEDFELFHRIRDEAKFYNIPEFLVYTRVRSNSNSAEINTGVTYNFLYPYAKSKLDIAGNKKEVNYWISKIGWINFFFGDKSEARKYLIKNITLKKTIASLLTLLPKKQLKKIIESRLKYRIKSLFESKDKYQIELYKLLET